MAKHDDDYLLAFVNDLDAVILKYQDQFENHNLAAMMLSRITLLMTHDPATGKGLLQFVWDKLDELEQSNPGQYL
jgi:hypothetical protein